MGRLPRWAPLGVAGLGLFVAALDAYVVVTLLAAMLSDLGLTVERLERASPIVTGFLAGYVVAMPLLGAFSDARGRLPAFLLCLLAYATGSAVTASAGLADWLGLPWLVGGRLLQGLGGGGLVPLALALAADLYQGRARVLALGGVAALQEAGSVLGPLYGALIAGWAAAVGGWRFVFWLNLPLAALVGLGLVVLGRRGQAVPRRAGSGVDWPGAALLGLGMALFTLALYPDDPAHRALNSWFLPAGVGALAALAGFGWRQLRRLEPLIPRALLLSRGFLGSSLANLLVGGALMVALVDVPIAGRAVFGLDSLGAGLLLSQFLVGVPAGALAGGWLAPRLGARWTALLGMLLAAAAFLLMSGWQADELHRLVAGGVRRADLELGLCGLGFGLVIAPLAAAVLEAAGADQHGLASSLVVLARTMGMVVGLAALTAFGLHRFYEILGPQTIGSGDLAAQMAALEKRVVAALLQEYREIFSVAAGLCLLAGLVAAAGLRGRSAAG